MIKLIIFDVGGVLDTFYESQYISYIAKKTGIDPIKFRAALIPKLDLMEIGKMKLPELKRALAKQFKVSISALEWDKAFTKLNKVNNDVVNLANRLSKNYKIVLLTNVSRSRHLMKMHSYLKKVKYDHIYASCYIKMRKPDRNIYEFVLEKTKAKPDETIFIDDLKRNTEGAKRVGIHAIHFVGYKDLVKRLKKFGI